MEQVLTTQVKWLNVWVHRSTLNSTTKVSWEWHPWISTNPLMTSIWNQLNSIIWMLITIKTQIIFLLEITSNGTNSRIVFLPRLGTNLERGIPDRWHQQLMIYWKWSRLLKSKKERKSRVICLMCFQVTPLKRLSIRSLSNWRVTITGCQTLTNSRKRSLKTLNSSNSKVLNLS